MNILGTHINYFLVCHRKPWFIANGVQMEYNSDLIYEGKQIHENTYTRRIVKFEEVEIGNKKHFDVHYFFNKKKDFNNLKLNFFYDKIMSYFRHIIQTIT